MSSEIFAVGHPQRVRPSLHTGIVGGGLLFMGFGVYEVLDLGFRNLGIGV